MAGESCFPVGVIEGFYGRPWLPEARLAYPELLASLGLNTYLYAPKSDAVLRRRWEERWETPQWRHLQQLSRACHSHGVRWGVGLSPFELYLNYSRPRRQALRDKLAYLAELDMPVLALLFDDMPGDLDALASRQAEIIVDVCHWLPSATVIVCPTYYSHDPLLEQYFGAMPEGYWGQLGRESPGDVRFFWTGNRVCSDSIRPADLRTITSALGRPVTLWDNYPVNDGAERSNFLYTSALDQRDGLEGLVDGHLCNPMNQALLSLPALLGLAQLYGKDGDDGFLEATLGAATWRLLQRDARAFQQEGRSGMGEARCARLASEYARLPGAAAREVREWLEGDYTFDPACLTG